MDKYQTPPWLSIIQSINTTFPFKAEAERKAYMEAQAALYSTALQNACAALECDRQQLIELVEKLRMPLNYQISFLDALTLLTYQIKSQPRIEDHHKDVLYQGLHKPPYQKAFDEAWSELSKRFNELRK